MEWFLLSYLQLWASGWQSDCMKLFKDSLSSGDWERMELSSWVEIPILSLETSNCSSRPLSTTQRVIRGIICYANTTKARSSPLSLVLWCWEESFPLWPLWMFYLISTWTKTPTLQSFTCLDCSGLSSCPTVFCSKKLMITLTLTSAKHSVEYSSSRNYSEWQILLSRPHWMKFERFKKLALLRLTSLKWLWTSKVR